VDFISFHGQSPIIAGAQEKEQQKVIKHVAIKSTSPASAEEMYTAYRAVCHGKDAKGNGPATEALKVSPPDLTVLAHKDGGEISFHARGQRYSR
jgi:hypothetical protein